MHEQSVTDYGPTGWLNMYGPATAQAGQVLPPRYPFEQTQYPTLQQADTAADLRSKLHGLGIMPGMPPQLLPPEIIQKLMILHMLRQQYAP